MDPFETIDEKIKRIVSEVKLECRREALKEAAIAMLHRLLDLTSDTHDLASIQAALTSLNPMKGL